VQKVAEPDDVAPARKPREAQAEPEPAAPQRPAPAEAPAPPAAQEPTIQEPPAVQEPQTREPVRTQVVQPEPQTPTSQTPQTQAPAPQTQAPLPSTGHDAAKPSEPSGTQEPSTARRAPVTESEPSTAASSSAPSAPSRPTQTVADQSPHNSTTGTPVPPSEAALEPGPESATPTSGTEAPNARSARSEPSEPATTTGAAGGTSRNATVTSEVSEAAKVIKTAEPVTLQADTKDVEVAKTAKIVEEKPAPAVAKDVDDFSSALNLSLGLGGRDGAHADANAALRIDRARDWNRKVTQWRPDWVQYDEFYRPVILNPFRAPVRLVYVYDRAPRIVYIPPLARIALDVARYAAYSFTAMVLNPINTAIDLAQNVVETAANVAIGSFFGGGYVPAIGLPLPPPPPPVLRYDNVPVQVRYSQQTYEPFRVRRIVDVGDDAQYGERKVLLDGVTPAWGEWTQTAGGERQFEVHKTQQFPGLDAPIEGPLPGDYPLRLASDESSTAGLTARDIFLYVAAGVVGTLGFGAIGMAFFLGRRRPEH
jgi:hypothetical protein